MLEQACENVSHIKNDFKLNFAKIAQNICLCKIHYSVLIIQISAFSKLQFVSFTNKKKQERQQLQRFSAFKISREKNEM